MYIRNTFLLGFSIALCVEATSQETSFYTQPTASITTAHQLYSQGLYGSSIQMARAYKDAYPESETLLDDQYIKADYLIALDHVKMDESIGEDLTLQNTRKYNDAYLNTLSFAALGDFYYTRNDFKKAASHYELAQEEDSHLKDDLDLSFRKAYSYFVQKDFKKASKNFSKLKASKHEYYYAANYYYAMSNYFEGDYDKAIKSLEIVKDYPSYSNYTPYYLGQLYYAQDQYDKCTSFLESSLDTDKKVYKKFELYKILGLAYLAKEQYLQALHNLEKYEENTDKLSVEEFYQLAIIYYKLDRYDDAIPTFENIATTTNKYQVSSLYHLADCFLQQGNKKSAKSIFQNLAANTTLSTEEKEEAMWKYAQISVELQQHREAINTLQEFNKNSKYYKPSRKLLAQVLYVSNDYENALKVLDKMESLDPDLQEAYQLICYNKATTLYNDGEVKQAKSYFEKVEKYPVDKEMLADSYFWIAQIYQQEGDFNKSNRTLEKYFTSGHIKDSSQGKAKYLLGHNQIKSKAYPQAKTSFTEAIKAIEAIPNRDTEANDMLTDAYARLGDAEFHNRSYKASEKAYKKSAMLGSPQKDYSLYQITVLQGLQGKYYDRLVSLETFTSTNPDSEFLDDAYYDTAETYLKLGKQTEAIKQYQQLVNTFDESSAFTKKAYLQLGLVSYNLGDTKAAVSYYEKVLDMNPSANQKKEAMTALQEIYIDDLGQADRFIDIASEQGIELSQYDKDSLSYTSGYNYYRNSKYTDAISKLENYIRSNKKGNYIIQAHYYTAESSSITKDYSNALEHYDAVIQFGMSDHYIAALKKAGLISYNHAVDFEKSYEYYNLLNKQDLNKDEQLAATLGALRSAFRTNKNEAVITYGNKLIALPHATASDRSTAYFYTGKAALKTGKTDGAIAAFNKVVATSNNNQTAESSYLLSKIFYDKGRLETAELQALETTKRSANYPFWVSKSLLLLSDIYSSNMDFLNAKAALEALIENYQDNEEILVEAQTKLDNVNQLMEEKNRIRIHERTDLLEMDTIPHNDSIRK